MNFQLTIIVSLILRLSLNTKTSHVVALVGDDPENFLTNMECAIFITHNGRLLCSATLAVDDNNVQFVLTTAKCLWNGSNKPTAHWKFDHLRVHGWTNAFSWKGELRTVKKVVVHPEFDPRYLYHDIAILIINENYHEKEGEFTACKLPPPGNTISGGLDMLGFGTHNIEYITNGRLGRIIVPHVNQDVCKTFGKYMDTQFCIGWLGKGGIGPCTGDEGGPILGRLVRGLYVAGIYSHIPVYGKKFRVGCGDAHVPAIATDIESHLPWINEQIQKRFEGT